RLDNPGDYLRLEVSTALKNEHVLVIPVLVQGARMPGPEDLPSDLEPLSRRNAIELSGARWDLDVDRLIRAIERASGLTEAPRRPAATIERAPEPPAEPQTEEFNLLEVRRRRQIAEHVRTAQQAFDAGDYEAVLEACEKAVWLDPHAADARALARKARAALDEQTTGRGLAPAPEILNPESLSDPGLAAASEQIDPALALNPSHDSAVKLRQDILVLRKRRERQREVDRQVRAAIARAQKSLEEEDYEAAIEFCDDAIALSGESA